MSDAATGATPGRPLLVLNTEPDYVQQVIESRHGVRLVEFEIDPDYMADQPEGFIVFEGTVYRVEDLSAEQRQEKGIPAFTDTWYEGPWRRATAADLEAWGLITLTEEAAPDAE